MPTLNAHLLELLERAAQPLPGVSRRRMFGCEALFRDAEIFALVWKEGRIGLKLTDPAQHAELMAASGSAPWSPGGRAVMRQWVLVPESFHDDEVSLARWTQRAHAGVASEPATRKQSRRA